MSGALPIPEEDPRVPGAGPVPAAPAPDPAPKPVRSVQSDLPAAPEPPTEIDGITATDDLPGQFERFGAAWRRRTVETDMWGYSERLARELEDELFASLAPEVQARLEAQREAIRTGSGMGLGEAERRAVLGLPAQWSDPRVAWRGQLLTEVARTRSGEAQGAALAPGTEEEFQDILLQRRREAYDQANEVLNIDGLGFGGFMGELSRDIADPVNLALMPFGVGGGVARTIAAETVLGGVAGALGLPREYAVADELDLPKPDALTRIATEALASGGLTAGLVALVRGAQAIKVRRRAAKDGKPPEMPQADHEDAQAEAEARLRGELPERPARAEPAAASRSELPPGAPANWLEIRNGIFAGESGGDYDALYGFQNRRGGRFANVKLTEMTVEEAIEFSRAGGEYGQWVKGQIGRVATPMGAYQIVGTTLRAAARAMKLQGDEIMSETLQDRIALWIYRTQGTGAWVGYRGPRSTPPARVSGDTVFAPQITRAGYTSQGQMRTAAGTRIDVTYEVVDASILTRASGDLQPRDRSLGNSDEQISDMAATLDPALLMPAPTADRGAPVVGPDNVIESGNGRYAAIVRASEQHPDRIDAYRKQVEAAGFDIPEDVRNPVLIARRTSDLDPDARRRFVVEAQDSGIARMTPVERSRAEAQALDAATLARLDPGKPLDDAANSDFLRAALARLPRSERNAFVTPQGRLNADGRKALERAIFARAFNDPELLRRFTEADAAELRSLLDALFQASPAWARLVADVADGTVRPEFDITGHVIEAMRLIANARKVAALENLRLGDVLAELIDEVDLLDGAISPLTRALVGKFWRNGRAASQGEVASFLTRFAEEARKVGRTDAGLFDEVPDVLDALRAVDPETFGDLTETGAAHGQSTAPAPSVEEVLRDGSLDQGASSPDAVEADRLAGEDLREALQGTRSEADALRSDTLADGDFVVPTEGGRPVMASELLEDIEDDQVLDTIVTLCTTGGRNAA